MPSAGCRRASVQHLAKTVSQRPSRKDRQSGADWWLSVTSEHVAWSILCAFEVHSSACWPPRFPSSLLWVCLLAWATVACCTWRLTCRRLTLQALELAGRLMPRECSPGRVKRGAAAPPQVSNVVCSQNCP